MTRLTNDQAHALAVALNVLNPDRAYPVDECDTCGHGRIHHIPEAGGCVGGVLNDCQCSDYRIGRELFVGGRAYEDIVRILAGHHASDPNWRPPATEEQP